MKEGNFCEGQGRKGAGEWGFPLEVSFFGCFIISVSVDSTDLPHAITFKILDIYGTLEVFRLSE